MDNKLRWQLIKYVVKVSQASDTPISELLRRLDDSTTPTAESKDDLKFYEDMLKVLKSPYKVPEIPHLFPGETEDDFAPPTRRE